MTAPRMVADHIPEATILFADIVDFTPFSGKHGAGRRGRQFLNRIFSAFDRLADRFGAEKIKTIGDAYMVAVGFPSRATTMPRGGARMALAMLEAFEALAGRDEGADPASHRACIPGRRSRA